jgi:hypothetical protein
MAPRREGGGKFSSREVESEAGFPGVLRCKDVPVSVKEVRVKEEKVRMSKRLGARK